MRTWLILLAVLLGACSGCGAMEDFVLGPDPYLGEHVGDPPAARNCGAPPPVVSMSQTQEPPLLR